MSTVANDGVAGSGSVNPNLMRSPGFQARFDEAHAITMADAFKMGGGGFTINVIAPCPLWARVSDYYR